MNTYIIMGVQVLCDVTPCHWVGRFRRFEGSCGLHLEVQAVQEIFGWTARKIQPGIAV